jgi:Retroviral aspartyl protease
VPNLPLPIEPQGCFLSILVGVSVPRAQALQGTVPKPVPARCLIDTGADCTVIDQRILLPLGISPINQCESHTLSNSGKPAEKRNQFEVSVAVPISATVSHMLVTTLLVMEGPLAHFGFDGLIGRDILALCSFVYNGPAKNVALIF